MKSNIVKGTILCFLCVVTLNGIKSYAEDSKSTNSNTEDSIKKDSSNKKGDNDETKESKDTNKETKNEDNNKINSSKDEKSNDKENKATIYSKNLNAKLDEYYNIKSQQYKANNKVEKLISDVSVIETKISDENDKIKENEEEIKKIDKRLKDNKDYLDKIARSNQINSSSSDNGIISKIFSNTSFSNFIRQAMGEETVANAQKERLDNIKKDKEQKEKLNKDIKASNDNLTKQKEKLESTQQTINANESVLSSTDKVEVLKETNDKLDGIRKDIDNKINDIKKDLENDKDNNELKEVLTKYEETAENISEKGITIKGRVVSGDTARDQIIEEALKYIGVPYVWGGKSPSGFDCSGFAGYVYRQATGKEIGGWTVPQESSGTKIPVEQAQEGDLLFWGSAGSSHHVAIALGNGQYIHAPTEGETVKVANYSSYAPSFAVKVLDD